MVEAGFIVLIGEACSQLIRSLRATGVGCRGATRRLDCQGEHQMEPKSLEAPIDRRGVRMVVDIVMEAVRRP